MDLDDFDVAIFATDLYNFIWWKFKFSIATDVIGRRMRDVIGIAVACQQLLVRNYLKEKFTLRHSYVLEHPGFVLEMATNMAQGKLDYFTHLFRCSAFIAEYFIYKKNCFETTNLDEASLIWIEMFHTKFTQNFEINGGWEAMISSAQKMSAEYYPLFEKYESRLFASEFRFIPRNLCTAFDKIKVEIMLGYAGYDLYDEEKEFRSQSFPCPCKNIHGSVETRPSESGSPLRKKSRNEDRHVRFAPGPSYEPSHRGSGSELAVDLRLRKMLRININRPWERIAYGPYGPLESSPSPPASPESSEVELPRGAEQEPAVSVPTEVQMESATGTSSGGPSEDIPMEEDP